MELDALQKAIRRASSSQVWSQGVRLAREGAVSHESGSEDEITLRVKAPGRAVALTVVLYPEDEDWECSCPNSSNMCAHIAAVIIALTQAQSGGQELKTTKAQDGKLQYHLRREGGGLALERVIASPSGETFPLSGTLSAILSGRAKAAEGTPSLSPEQADLNIDRLLSTRARGRLPSDRLIHLLTALAGHDGVFFAGEPVKVADKPLLPRAVLEDIPNDGGGNRGGGVRLIIDRDPCISDVLTLEVGFGNGTLYRLGATDISGRRLENLPLVRTATRGELPKLLDETIPQLAKRIPVDIRTSAAPQLDRNARPEMTIDITHHLQGIVVFPKLLYLPADGGKPLARMDGSRLVHLQGAIPVRDEDGERRLIHRLRAQLDLIPGKRVVLQGAEAIAFRRKLADWSGNITGDLERDNFRDMPELVPQISVEFGDTDGAHFFDVAFAIPAHLIPNHESSQNDGDSDGKQHLVPATDVLRAWRQGDGLVPLPSGGLAPVPSAWLAAHGQLVADLIAARSDKGTLPIFALPDLARLCADLDHPAPPGLDRLTPLMQDFEKLPKAVPPTDLNAELRPYQQSGVRWLQFLHQVQLGGILADDMGLGKTLQALCVINGRTLVVCPTSVIHNWAAEIARFRTQLRVNLYHGSRRSLDTDADVIITTYGLLRIDNDILAEQKWDMVVLDEAQAIKNPNSRVARAAYGIQARFRLALSGTPVENRLDELWSLMHFANPGLLGGRSDFRDSYANPIGNGDGNAAARLRRRIRPFVLRRMKSEVAPELPPRTDSVLYVELEDDERTLYDAVRNATRQEIVEKLAQGGSVLAALEALLRLRQASCHRGLLPGQQADTSAKVRRLCEALEVASAEGRKALVFSQWTSLLDLIEPHLHAADIGFIRLDGKTRDRAQVVAQFQDPAGPEIMLISLRAGGTGLNLTAADHVFLCDPWWNPAVEDQAADRAHRIGQDKPVMVYRLVAKDTVEERILALQQKKRAIADAALGEAGAAAALTREDLLALLD